MDLIKDSSPDTEVMVLGSICSTGRFYPCSFRHMILQITVYFCLLCTLKRTCRLWPPGISIVILTHKCGVLICHWCSTHTWQLKAESGHCVICPRLYLLFYLSTANTLALAQQPETSHLWWLVTRGINTRFYTVSQGKAIPGKIIDSSFINRWKKTELQYDFDINDVDWVTSNLIQLSVKNNLIMLCVTSDLYDNQIHNPRQQYLSGKIEYWHSNETSSM